MTEGRRDDQTEAASSDAPHRRGAPVPELAARDGRGSHADGPSIATVVAVLLLLALGAGVVAFGAQRILGERDLVSVPLEFRHRWTTEVVDAQVADLAIEANGRRFVGVAPIEVQSDPGSADYWTLELSWREHGTEMRMNLYFAADTEHWWVTELRTYDGREPADWTYYKPALGAPLGRAWTGTIDLVGTTPGTHLRIAGLRLTAAPTQR